MAPKAVLVGMPGSGKSTIGRRWPRACACRCSTLTRRSSRQPDARIADIFTEDGEQEFRRIEEEVVKAALATHDGIVSLGGGAITSPGVRAALAGHTVVYLEIGRGRRHPAHHRGRTRAAAAGSGAPAEKYRALMAERVPLLPKGRHAARQHQPAQPGAVVAAWHRLENLGPAANRRKRRHPWRLLSPQPAILCAPAVPGGRTPTRPVHGRPRRHRRPRRRWRHGAPRPETATPVRFPPRSPSPSPSIPRIRC